jgi:tRNA dimethylallyltransferase
LYLRPKRTQNEIERRILRRIKVMLSKGVIEELKKLLENGYSLSSPAMSANCYPIIKKFVDKEINKEELIDMMVLKDRQYSKRQETWFKRYNYNTVKDEEHSFELVENFLEG